MCLFIMEGDGKLVGYSFDRTDGTEVFLMRGQIRSISKSNIQITRDVTALDGLW